jgi:BASS family bile acid:Na+ symporter
LVRALIAYVIPATNFLLLAAVGLDLTLADFARVRRQYALLIAGLVAPVILLPLVAVGVTALFNAGPTLAASVFLVAACPIGGVSNTYSYLARASTALSVTLTGLSCIAATVTIPLIGKGLELVVDRPLGLSAPISILTAQLVLMLALPVAVGMWVRQSSPAFAERHSPLMRTMAVIGTAMVLLLVIADAPAAFVEGLGTTVPLAAVFVVGSVAVGWGTAAVFTSNPRDRFTVAAEFGARNVAISMAIAVTLLGNVEFARFAVIYALTEVPLLLIAVSLFRRHQSAAGSGRPAQVA